MVLAIRRHGQSMSSGASIQSQSRAVLGHDGDGRLSVAWNTLGRDTDAPITPALAKALAAVRDGDVKIVPQRFEKVWYSWLENVRDW